VEVWALHKLVIQDLKNSKLPLVNQYQQLHLWAHIQIFRRLICKVTTSQVFLLQAILAWMELVRYLHFHSRHLSVMLLKCTDINSFHSPLADIHQLISKCHQFLLLITRPLSKLHLNIRQHIKLTLVSIRWHTHQQQQLPHKLSRPHHKPLN